MSAEVIHSSTHVVIVHPAVVAEDGFGIIAVCSSPVIADRLAKLWTRYGIADVPDTAEVVCVRRSVPASPT